MRLPRLLTRTTVAGVALLAMLGAAACEGRTPRTTGAPHGQLTLLSLGPVATWDPQRLSSPQDIAVAGRLFLRTLTAFPAGADGAAQRSPVGDLATDTGTADASLRTWSFTLRHGATWQDGSPVTCGDVRYGVSRSFAAPFSTEGLNYPLALLDIPRTPDGRSTYAGPFSGTGQSAFDRAVSCHGSTVTFRLSLSLADFPQVVALPVFAPYKKSQDKGPDGSYTVFSDGPYRLQAAWDPSSGGTFVRNERWDRTSDPVRAARPDSLRYVEGTESQTAVQQVVDDAGATRAAVTLDSAPPAMQQQVLSDPGLKARSVNPAAQFVDYLAPSLRSAVMRNDDVRKAFAVATNREGYVTALGGESTAAPAYSLIGSPLPAHGDDDVLGGGVTGDPAAARDLLEKSGMTLPVPVRVAYRSSPTADKAMAALVNRWQEAGFAVRLQPLDKDYFTAISTPGAASRTDVFWANWAPSWPSAGTVLQPLFDSRLNLTGSGTGRDYGAFADPAVDREMGRISGLADAGTRAAAWSALDTTLVRRSAYIALAQRKALYVAGSDVTGLSANEALGGFVDLATVGVR
ncbi:ABC transporter substrate-binding protein [Pedococcus sp. 5OH_020]|uniref:ABC transporter substrate-binding protein n=1 Tax=Pedococcus sp. 5OH_020 TaxID=2989814 RepID=UPI0022EA0514|nr:ABC transporter substrate-binding protein [Pedococcus sp. 5OH_020]